MTSPITSHQHTNENAISTNCSNNQFKTTTFLFLILIIGNTMSCSATSTTASSSKVQSQGSSSSDSAVIDTNALGASETITSDSHESASVVIVGNSDSHRTVSHVIVADSDSQDVNTIGSAVNPSVMTMRDSDARLEAICIKFEDIKTDTPIIGVLSQETHSVQGLFPGEEFLSYIAASYVKFIEMGGARVVPIWIGRDRTYYEKVVNYTNGLFMPGGATWFNQSDGYADAGQHLYDIAVERNERGDYYPIWGTCLGMELLIQVSLNGQEIRDHCSALKISMPLVFKPDFRNSKMFASTSAHIIDILQTQNVTYNYHTYCFTEATFSKHGLDEHFKVMSTNLDINGLEFISTYEHVKYPFFGVQFHPEKNPFEFKFSSPILEHTDAAIEVSQYFSRFVTGLARQCAHAFDNKEQMQNALLYNFTPRYTYILNGSYEQIYTFTKEDNLRQL